MSIFFLKIKLATFRTNLRIIYLMLNMNTLDRPTCFKNAFFVIKYLLFITFNVAIMQLNLVWVFFAHLWALISHIFWCFWSFVVVINKLKWCKIKSNQIKSRTHQKHDDWDVNINRSTEHDDLNNWLCFLLL